MRDIDMRRFTEPKRDVSVVTLADIPPGRAPDTKRSNPPEKPMNVALIDSQSLTRECMTSSISAFLGDSTVFPFLSVPEFQTGRTSQCNLIVLCLHGSDYQPLEILRSLRSADGDCAVFLISDRDYQIGPEFIRAASRLGARGFVSTRTTSLALALSAMRFVQAGGIFAPSNALLLSSPPRRPSPTVQSDTGLTARETTVLELLKEGKTNKVIAEELHLSGNTVKVHVHNILRKMRASNRMEAASRGSRAVAVSAENGSALAF